MDPSGTVSPGISYHRRHKNRASKGTIGSPDGLGGKHLSDGRPADRGVEILGAQGLILPSLTGIMPRLTPLVAAGLALTMVEASLTHYRRNEFSRIRLTTLLLVMALFLVVGRTWIMPI